MKTIIRRVGIFPVGISWKDKIPAKIADLNERLKSWPLEDGSVLHLQVQVREPGIPYEKILFEPHDADQWQVSPESYREIVGPAYADTNADYVVVLLPFTTPTHHLLVAGSVVAGSLPTRVQIFADENGGIYKEGSKKIIGAFEGTLVHEISHQEHWINGQADRTHEFLSRGDFEGLLAQIRPRAAANASDAVPLLQALVLALQGLVQALTRRIAAAQRERGSPVLEPAVPIFEKDETIPKSRLVEWATSMKKFEDYVLPGGKFRDGSPAPIGSLSYRNKNPGNLRWSKYMIGQDSGEYAIFSDYETGWTALLFQLQIAADGRSKRYQPNMTLLDFFKVYAPRLDGNHPKKYAEFVAKDLKVDITTQIKTLL